MEYKLIWSSLNLRQRASMDTNQELTVAGIGCSCTNSSIYSLMLFLRKGWGSSAVCLHQGCPASVTPCSIFSWRTGNPRCWCSGQKCVLQGSVLLFSLKQLPGGGPRLLYCKAGVSLAQVLSVWGLLAVFSLFLLCPALGSWSAMEKCSCRPKNRFPEDDLRTNQTQGIWGMLLPPV